MAQALVKVDSPTKASPPVLKSVMIETRKQEVDSKLFSVSSEKLDLGPSTSLRYKILTRVLSEDYEKALDDIKNYMLEEHEFPNFKQRVSRLMNHCTDLIYAIKAKRNFQGLSSLTRPKQQELREKYLEHFRELQLTLRRVETIQTDLRLVDARSTIYVVRVVWVSVFSISVLAFALELMDGLAANTFLVLDDFYTHTVQYLLGLAGL